MTYTKINEMLSNLGKTMEKIHRAVQWWREGVVWLGASCVKINWLKKEEMANCQRLLSD